jgi:hypothetical protein
MNGIVKREREREREREKWRMCSILKIFSKYIC